MEILKKIEKDVLFTSCYSHGNELIRKQFTDDEIQSMKNELYQLIMFQRNRMKLIQDVKEFITKGERISTYSMGDLFMNHKEYGETPLKLLKATIAELLDCIKKGYEVKEGKVYYFDYQEIGKMAAYDENGNYLYDRPLTKTERQAQIQFISKAN